MNLVVAMYLLGVVDGALGADAAPDEAELKEMRKELAGVVNRQLRIENVRHTAQANNIESISKLWRGDGQRYG